MKSINVNLLENDNDLKELLSIVRRREFENDYLYIDSQKKKFNSMYKKI